MIALFFMIYALIGVAAGWGVYTFAAVELPLAICGGAIMTALLGQVHLFATRAGESTELSTRIDQVESTQKDTAERIDVIEAFCTSADYAPDFPLRARAALPGGAHVNWT